MVAVWDIFRLIHLSGLWRIWDLESKEVVYVLLLLLFVCLLVLNGTTEFTQTHVHQVSEAIQPSHPLLP